ncbi:MAG: orotidine-5'-phosphate decarboxylase, partial [Desulfurococcaceae archaeon]
MKYPIIIALDPPYEIENPVEWCIKIIRETEDKVIGYKIGLPLLIRTGLEKLRGIIKQMNKTDLIIADLKLA